MTTTHFIADAGQHPTSPPGPTDAVVGPIGVYVRLMAELIRDHPPGDCWSQDLIGHVVGGVLEKLAWQHEDCDERDELADCAEQLGLQLKGQS